MFWTILIIGLICFCYWCSTNDGDSYDVTNVHNKDIGELKHKPDNLENIGKVPTDHKSCRKSTIHRDEERLQAHHINQFTTSLSGNIENKSVNPNIFFIHRLRRKLYDFVVVDIETTGIHYYDQIIQLSAIKYLNDKKVASFNKLIKPDASLLPLSPEIERMTGITTSSLTNKRSFTDVKNEFLTFVGDLPWIGHNINRFDIPKLNHEGLGRTEYYALDTLPLAKRSISENDINNYKLPTLKKFYGVHNKSHNSLNDCVTTAIVYQHLRDGDTESYLDKLQRPSNSLTGKTFTTSGRLKSVPKKTIIAIVNANGGSFKDNISSKVDFLIKENDEQLHNQKELTARKFKIPTITTEKFLSMVKKTTSNPE